MTPQHMRRAAKKVLSKQRIEDLSWGKRKRQKVKPEENSLRNTIENNILAMIQIYSGQQDDAGDSSANDSNQRDHNHGNYDTESNQAIDRTSRFRIAS